MTMQGAFRHARPFPDKPGVLAGLFTLGFGAHTTMMPGKIGKGLP